jgi:hypothetical protein
LVFQRTVRNTRPIGRPRCVEAAGQYITMILIKTLR